MLSSIARAALRLKAPAKLATTTSVGQRFAPVTGTQRHFSSTDPRTFQPDAPAAVTRDMAEGIQDTTLFYLRHGVSNQRLEALAKDSESPLVMKWQRMMEIYLSTQVFVINGLGYPGNEQGLETYTRHLSTYINEKCDDETKDMYRKVGNETWKEILSTAFNFDKDEVEPLSIVDARNVMHKVSSKMQDPAILMKIQKECGKIPENADVEMELAQKHQVLQSVIVDDVYMGGSPNLVEECGFGSGEQGYARMQCVLAEHEADPLIAQYAGAAMMRIWDAAGLDMAAIQKAGNIRVPGGAGGL